MDKPCRKLQARDQMTKEREREQKKKNKYATFTCRMTYIKIRKLNRNFPNRKSIDDDDVMSRHHSGTQMSTLISECLQRVMSRYRLFSHEIVGLRQTSATCEKGRY